MLANCAVLTPDVRKPAEPSSRRLPLNWVPARVSTPRRIPSSAACLPATSEADSVPPATSTASDRAACNCETISIAVEAAESSIEESRFSDDTSVSSPSIWLFRMLDDTRPEGSSAAEVMRRSDEMR